jgi:hypothetical protein
VNLELYASLLFHLLFTVFTAVVGEALIRRGWRGTRRGDSPHCPQCDYNLTGLESPRCPECGTVLVPDEIPIGQLHRSPAGICMGLVTWGVTVCLAVTLYHGVRHTLRSDWYFLRPTSVVIDDLHDRQLIERAPRELSRRLKSDSLTDGQKKLAAEAVISIRVASRQAARYSKDMVNFAANLLRSDNLTPAQTEAFFRSLEKAEFRISSYRGKPCVGQGDTWHVFPTQADAGYIPRRILTCVSIDGQPVDETVLDRFELVDGTSGLLSDSLPRVPQNSMVLRVTTRWYDFGADYSRERRHELDFDREQEVQQALHDLADEPVCEYQYKLLLNPGNNWEASSPIPADPAKPPATTPASSQPTGSPAPSAG